MLQVSCRKIYNFPSRSGSLFSITGEYGPPDKSTLDPDEWINIKTDTFEGKFGGIPMNYTQDLLSEIFISLQESKSIPPLPREI